MTTVDLFFLAQRSLFPWALLAGGLGYTLAAVTERPVLRLLALALLLALMLGTVFELGIALVWRLFFGNFDDTPTFTFSAFTVVYVAVALLCLWPFRRASTEAMPRFDLPRAARGLLVGVALALALGFGDALFRLTHLDPFLEFRGFVWYFFAVRGIGGALIGGVATAALGGFLPRLIKLQGQLPRLRVAALGSILLVLALMTSVLLRGSAG